MPIDCCDGKTIIRIHLSLWKERKAICYACTYHALFHRTVSQPIRPTLYFQFMLDPINSRSLPLWVFPLYLSQILKMLCLFRVDLFILPNWVLCFLAKLWIGKHWTVSAHRTVSAMNGIGNERCLQWKVSAMNGVYAELCLHTELSVLNCVCTKLCLHTEPCLTLNRVSTKLCLHTELCLHWSVSMLNCVCTLNRVCNELCHE